MSPAGFRRSIAALVSLAVLLGPSSGGEAGSAQTRSARAAPAGPDIRILSAWETARDTVRVRVRISHWTIHRTRPGRATKTGGYWLIWVDGRRDVASRSPRSDTTTTLAPGLHHLRAELVREDGRVLRPRARSIVFTVTVGATSPSFPLIAEYGAVNRAAVGARFDLNVLNGHNVGIAAEIKARDPSSLVFLQPRVSIGDAYRGWAATYGGYAQETGCTSGQTGPVRAYLPTDDYGVVYGERTVNWARGDTAVWSADVRACHAVVDNGILARPIDGIWGDNQLWATVDLGLTGAAATAWDNGNAANVAELNRVLPGLLVGGNDASGAFGRATYKGTIRGGDTRANFGMKESVQRRGFFDGAGFDKVLSAIVAWNGLPGRRGEILNVNPGGLPAPLDDAQKRIALAGAVISGAYLWLVDGRADSNDWGKTVVPGGAGSIPQLGQAAGYPRGYLGRPSGPAVHVAAGRWYRGFDSGYRVYANVTSAPWTVDAAVVPPGDALFAR